MGKRERKSGRDPVTLSMSNKVSHESQDLLETFLPLQQKEKRGGGGVDRKDPSFQHRGVCVYCIFLTKVINAVSDVFKFT